MISQCRATRFIPNIPARRWAGLALFILIMWVSTASSGEVVDRIAAVVNDDIILLSELNRAAAPLEAQVRAKKPSPEAEREQIYRLRQEILNNLIDDRLADQEIKTAGIFVEDREIDNAIAQVKAQNYYSDEDLRGALTASGVTMDEYRDEIKKQMQRNQLVNQRVKSRIIITDTDVLQYYNSHPEKYGSQKKYVIYNILMSAPQDGGPEKTEMVRQKMAEIRQKLQNGAPFDETARAYSEAVNARDGGRLGAFPLEELAPNIKKAVEPLKPGEVSQVVLTDQGFQIFYLEAIQPAGERDLADASPEIRRTLHEKLVNEKFQAWIEALRKDAHIKIIQ